MLLYETTLNSMPRLYAQEDVGDPTIYAKIATPDETWACYVAEAGKTRGDYTIFALFVSEKWGHNWAQVGLHEVEQDLKHASLDARVVEGFTRGPSSKHTGILRR